MIASVLLVAAVVSFSALAVILAIPDLDVVLAGEVADPVVDTLLIQLGPGLAQPIFILFLVAFIATLIAVQTSASRMVFALARDNALPGAGALRKLRERDRMPVNAVLTVAVAGALILMTTLLGEVYGMLIGFTVGGFFVTFTIVLWAALVARARRRWTPGAFSLGALGMPLTIVAAIWASFQFVNIAWPRTPDAPWYINYAVPLMIVVLLIVGAVVYRVVHQGILPPIAVPDDEDEEHQGHVADRAPMTQTTATEHRKETA
jgi:amino acid transporter